MELIIYTKMDLALNNLQRLICHKTQQTKPNQTNIDNFLTVIVFLFDINNLYRIIRFKATNPIYPRGIVLKIEICPYYQMVYVQTRIHPGG